MNAIYKLYNYFFHRVTVQQLKDQELYTAQCAQLQAQTQLEYYQAMVEFNRQRIQRLRPLQHETPQHIAVASSNHK